jgi:glycosyltransferase involved in cell wall biosynthesis
MVLTKLSIIIPCYNEEKTIIETINNIRLYNEISHEIVIVDDGSKDGTKDILKNFIEDENIKIIFKVRNEGKGSAIIEGLRHVTGDITLIQDADLEYSPKDYKLLLRPFQEADADVVYGSRFLGGSGYVRLHYYFHFIANKLLTNFCNIFTNLNMTDMETGYKVFKTEVIKSINLVEKSFTIEPEITIKLAKKNFKFFEIGISYRGRSYEEGKKITLKDAFYALIAIVKYGFFKK